MIEPATAADPAQDLCQEVECPDCEQRVEVSIPDEEVEPTVSQYVTAFGDYSVVYCPAGHKFWVYYC